MLRKDWYQRATTTGNTRDGWTGEACDACCWLLGQAAGRQLWVIEERRRAFRQHHQTRQASWTPQDESIAELFTLAQVQTCQVLYSCQVMPSRWDAPMFHQKAIHELAEASQWLEWADKLSDRSTTWDPIAWDYRENDPAFGSLWQTP